MEIVYYKDPQFNFGDDLNEYIWPRILSGKLRNADDIILAGIGSILTEEKLGKYSKSKKRLVILGSGTSYGQPPVSIDRWLTLSVRGPLTAAVIRKPESSTTDSAILLAAIPEMIDPKTYRTEVLFMPHHRSILTTPWQQIARGCGFTYVSPQQPVEEVLARFKHAKLVVTEAMHGAIVADSLRIPWIPVTISPAIEEFKWRDWCQSMNLPFNPVALSGGNSVDRYKFDSIRTMLLDAGITGHEHLVGVDNADALRLYLEKRFSPKLANMHYSWPGNRVGRALHRSLSAFNRFFYNQSAKSLLRASSTRSYLSNDTIFNERLQQTQAAVGALEKLV
jgi:succinoglycan biosynthesis protein ExoV